MYSEPLPAGSTKYLHARVCREFGSQTLAFMEAAALAYLLNVTLVLPKFYRKFNPRQAIAVPASTFDPQGPLAVGMDYYWDVGHLQKHLNPVLRTVTSLPPYLEGDPDGHILHAVRVDGANPNSLQKYQKALVSQQVLYINCVLRTVQWNTQGLWELRLRLLRALKPGQRVTLVANQFREAANAYLRPAGVSLQPGAFVALQRGNRPSEDLPKCTTTSAAASPLTIGGPDCHAPGDQVASMISSVRKSYGASLGAAADVLFLAGNTLTSKELTSLMTGAGLKAIVHSNGVMCRQGLQVECTTVISVPAEEAELQAALEVMVLSSSLVAWGHSQVGGSFLVRLAKNRNRDVLREPNSALYYNEDAAPLALDVSAAETAKYGHHAWLNQTLYSTERPLLARLLSLHKGGECTSVLNWKDSCAADKAAAGQAAPKEVLSISIQEIQCVGDVVQVDGKVVSKDTLGMRYAVEVALGKPAVAVASATSAAAAKGVAPFRAYLRAPAGGASAMDATVSACLQNEPNACASGVVKVCLAHNSIESLQQSREPIVYITIKKDPGNFGGGRQSMHQLHEEINRLHAEGELAVRSVLVGANPQLLGRYGNVSDSPLTPSQVTPYDYFLPPEVREHLPLWHKTLAPSSGALTLVYYLGHFSNKLEGTLDAEGYKPLCRDHYLGLLYRCPPKANLIAPMAARIYEEAGKYQATQPKPPKEDIVLLDPDRTGALDITRIKVPPGGQFIILTGFSMRAVFDLYRRSKVYIDSFMTGIERAILESALFDVVPIFAHNGNGIDAKDFPIDAHWRWQPHNYTQLNELIAEAIKSYPASKAAFDPLRARTHELVQQYPLQVAHYFQDDVHIMIAAYAQGGLNHRSQGLLAILTYISTSVMYPFATQEVVAGNPWYWAFDYSLSMKRFVAEGWSDSLTQSAVLPELKRYPPDLGIYLQLPSSRHLREFVVILPPGMLPVHAALMRALFKTARKRQLDVVRGPEGVWLVRRPIYYPSIVRLYPLLSAGSISGPDALAAGLEQLGLRIGSLGQAELADGLEGQAAQGCTSAAVHLLGEVTAVQRCLCPHIGILLRHRLFVSNMKQLPDQDVVQASLWRRRVLNACSGTDVATGDAASTTKL